MTRRIRFRLHHAFLAQLLVALAMSATWWYPKKVPLTFADAYTGYYRGFGLNTENTLLGRSFFKIVVDEGRLGRWTVDYETEGFNSYKGWYSDGTLREEGTCLVETVNSNEPTPDVHVVESGRYYSPDGKLASCIRSGTGVQTYFYPNGRKRWQLEVESYKRRHLVTWYENGQVCLEEHYEAGQLDGSYISYYSDGRLRTRGAYLAGEKVGEWIHVDELGNVEVKLSEVSNGHP